MHGWEKLSHPVEGGQNPQFPLSCKSAQSWLMWELRKRKLTKNAGVNSQVDLQHPKLVDASGPLFTGMKSVRKDLKYPRGAKLTSDNQFWRAYRLWYPDEASQQLAKVGTRAPDASRHTAPLHANGSGTGLNGAPRRIDAPEFPRTVVHAQEWLHASLGHAKTAPKLVRVRARLI
jgi:hypothetical protein